jgi:hypothetical protein
MGWHGAWGKTNAWSGVRTRSVWESRIHKLYMKHRKIHKMRYK